MIKILYFLLLTTVCFAQEVDSLYITPDGLNGYLVLNTPGESNQLHKKVEEWVKYNFKNPDEVIKSSIEGELLRCDMYYPDSYGLEYSMTLELKFKNDKIKYEIISLKPKGGGQPIFLSGGAFDVCLFNKRGEPRERADWMRISIANHCNSVAQSITNYINGDTTEDDW